MAITRYAVRTVADNYDPPRAEVWLTAEVYDGTDNVRDHDSLTVVLLAPDALRDATRAVYIWDDGSRVLPLYVAGFRPDAGRVFLVPYPVETDDGGRAAVLGPRRSYHLKAQAVDLAADNV